MRGSRASVKTWRATVGVVLVAAAAVAGWSVLDTPSSGPRGDSADSVVGASAREGGLPVAGGLAGAAQGPPVVYVPPGLPPGRVPLVIALHGTGEDPTRFEGTTGFDRVAREHGFIVAYLPSSSPRDNWILPSETPVISAMIDHLEATQPIDPARVYVTGYSAGGYESYRSGCLLSDKVAAVAPVAVSMNRVLYDTCKVARPVSALIVIGGADTGHYGGYGRLPSAPEAAARWRGMDGCAAESPSSSTAPGPTTQQLWSGCADGSAVGLYVVTGGTHVWPGPQHLVPGPDARYNASEAIWAFFAAHRAGSLRTPDAQLSSLQVRLRGHTRDVVFTLSLGEGLVVRATLARASRAVSSARLLLGRGVAVVSLPAAQSSGSGRYIARLVLTDPYGRSLTLVRTVDLASAAGRR
jgi:polyhydroxybutyrate depolymerase